MGNGKDSDAAAGAAGATASVEADVAASTASSAGPEHQSSAATREMQGRILKWGPRSSHIAFVTGSHRRHLVFIGGLTDGLLAVPYIATLGVLSDSLGWSLVQTQLSSSYIGYGISSLDQDADEMDILFGFLSTREKSEGVIIAGHSTGCQDIVHYLRKEGMQHIRLVKGAVLQAPASDREYLATLSTTAETLKLAQEMIAHGKGDDLMPRNTDPCAPITAYRFNSLAGMDGDDDYFSSDLSDEQLRARLAHMAGTPSLVLVSEKDEYVPSHINKQALLERLCAAMGGESSAASGLIVAGADHALYGGKDEALTAMADFIHRVSAL